MASIKQRSRRDSSCYWDVMFRLDGRQRSVSFQTEEHAKKFRDLVDLVGAVKALEVYKINPSPRSTSAGITVEQWLSRSAIKWNQIGLVRD